MALNCTSHHYTAWRCFHTKALLHFVFLLLLLARSPACSGADSAAAAVEGNCVPEETSSTNDNDSYTSSSTTSPRSQKKRLGIGKRMGVWKRRWVRRIRWTRRKWSAKLAAFWKKHLDSLGGLFLYFRPRVRDTGTPGESTRTSTSTKTSTEKKTATGSRNNKFTQEKQRHVEIGGDPFIEFQDDDDDDDRKDVPKTMGSNDFGIPAEAAEDLMDLDRDS